MIRPETFPERKGVPRGPTIGRCIYCDSTAPPLTREHIIPESLAGRYTLLQASCEACREITRRNEEKVAREIFQDLRAELRLKVKQPREFVLLRDGFDEDSPVVGTMRAEDSPRFLFLFVPEPAGIMLRRPRDQAVPTKPFFLDFGNDAERKARRDACGLPSQFTRALDAGIFGRFLAKVGLGFAVYHYGIDGIDLDPIRRVITGTDEPFHFVGGTPIELLHDVPPSPTRAHHIVVTFHLTDRNNAHYAAVQLRLFPQLGLPVFTIVVGQLTAAGIEKTAMPNKFLHA